MHPRYAKRQTSDLTAVPSASGISGSRTAGNPTATRLIVGTDTGLGSKATDGPEFAPGTSLVVTSTRTTSFTPSQTPSESQSSSTKSAISLSAVIGICIGAFVGAVFLICLGIWFYRRSSRPPPRARQQQPIARSHGVNPSSNWMKFDDDKWEGRNEMAERAGPGGVVPPRTRSTKRSLISEDSFGSQHDVAAQSMPFSQYNVSFTKQMALEPPRPVGADDQPKPSLDGSTTGTYLSLGTVHIESGKMSPTFNMAKATPPATASKLHQWESAEVVDPDADAQEVEVHPDLFSEKSTPTTYSPTDTVGDRKSLHNPFFNAHPSALSRRPSATGKSSAMSISSDPFNGDEEEIMTMPKPKFISHTTHDSSSSGGSLGNGKSMQGLIAALGLPQAVIEERLRIASMHPSEISRYSTTSDSYAMPMPETAEGYVAQ